MSSQPYKAYEINFLWDGAEPTCLTGLVFSEDTQTVTEVRTNGSWKRYRTSLQGFSIQLEGIDQTAYALFKASGKEPIDFAIASDDNELQIQGQAIVQNLTKARTPEEIKFSVTLIGHTAIQVPNVTDYLLLQDGDYILLQDGGRIIIR